MNPRQRKLILAHSLPAIAAEHRQLFLLISNFQAGVRIGWEHPQLAALYERVIGLSIAHFAHEESLLSEIEHPGFATHESAHGKMIADLAPATYLDSLDPGGIELQHMFDAILVHHIREDVGHFFADAETDA